MKKTTGKTIAEARRALGMTQLELAQKMGVTDKAVSKWERDLSCPDVSTLPRLAQVLGLSMEALLVQELPSGPAPKPGGILELVLKGVGLAMGIAVAVLTVLDALDVRDGMVMLGIGLACTAAAALERKGQN